MEAHVRIQALVQAVDTTASTITLLGKTVKVTAQTELRDKSKKDNRTFSLADLKVGDAVEVRAFEDTTNGIPNLNIVATRLERQKNALDRVTLQGRMDTKNPASPSLTIVGIKVQGGPNTQWRLANEQPVAAATWFDQTALGTNVKAQGAEGTDHTSLDATAGQVEVDDD
jgi:hypothetical protein